MAPLSWHWMDPHITHWASQQEGRKVQRVAMLGESQEGGGPLVPLALGSRSALASLFAAA